MPYSLLIAAGNGAASIAVHVAHWMYRRHQYRLAVQASLVAKQRQVDKDRQATAAQEDGSSHKGMSSTISTVIRNNKKVD